ncbi:hypothetical protein A0H81_14409 [Grifola frondosa]|uniref:F-box domain-containing protein n=1 Tax=Grifola frondosa TaxID=5627 RepID=A0A1C7LLN7_GRIFR|nr:hypothetical protein A0H81_14409 [Grifola frondosa]
MHSTFNHIHPWNEFYGESDAIDPTLMTLGHIQRTQIKNIIAELNRQATEHQLRRRYLIGQIHADQSYQHEVKRLGDSYGWNIFRASPDGWRVYLREAEMDGFQFSPAVCELMNQVHVNEASLSCVLAKIEALSTLVVPVQSLPTEVLVMIFKAGCRMPHPDPVSDSGDPRRIPFPLLVSSVSRYWRDVAINTPSLWTNITIKQTKPLGWVPLCLQRSGGQLLDITIDCRPLATLTAAVVDDIVARLMLGGVSQRRIHPNSNISDYP